MLRRTTQSRAHRHRQKQKKKTTSSTNLTDKTDNNNDNTFITNDMTNNQKYEHQPTLTASHLHKGTEWTTNSLDDWITTIKASTANSQGGSASFLAATTLMNQGRQ
jgi:hypothetical protein